MVKGLVPSLMLLESDRNFNRWGWMGGLVAVEWCLERDIWTADFHFLACCFLAAMSQTACRPCAPAMNCYLVIDLKTLGSTEVGLNTPKL